MQSISVIVSNFNGAKYLPRLINTLKKQEGVELELIVVDRNSTDDSDSILAGFPGIKVVKYAPEYGLVAGYTAGLPHASHDLLFFCNEDMWFAPSCLSECVKVLFSSEKGACVMPVQWTYDGKAIVNAGIWYERCFWSRSDPVLTRTASWHLVAHPARLSFANAGACLVRRDAFVQAGGWDTSFFLDCEDVDLGMRLWQLGWECWVAPAAIVGHAVGASNQKLLPNTGSSVGRKRYVSSFSNFLTIALKYFSIMAVPRAFLAFADVMLHNALKGRWCNLWLDLKVLALTFKRTPEWGAWRKTNAKINQTLPGENFFFEKNFQYSAIQNNRSSLTQVKTFE